MMKKRKTWIALFALLIMVFAMSASASAASSKTVAKIGSKKYSSLQKALNSVKKGQTIKLTKNVTLTGFNELIFKKNVKYTLNLNNKTIKHKDSGYAFFYMKKGTVTIKNGTISACTLYIQNSVKATFQNIKVTAPKGYSSTTIRMSTKPSLTLKKCKMTKTRFEPKDKSKLTISGGNYASVCNYGTGTVTINSGTFQAISNGAKGKTVINNATINNKENLYPLSVRAGTMTIRNMTCRSVSACITVSSGATLNISGGTFTTTTTVGGTVLRNAGTAFLSGGTYTTKNTNYIYKDEGIWNSGKLTIGSNAKLVNCGVVEAH